MAKAAGQPAFLAPDQARALAAACCTDPFALLGQHAGRIRALVPGAHKVWATVDSVRTPLASHPDVPELFEAALPAGPYRLAAEDADGQGWDWDDPYRFGPVLGEIDEYLLGEGRHQRLWKALGAHLLTHEGVAGTHFAVWAPGAIRVSVVGPFNQWDGRRAMMRRRGATGVWEVFLPAVGPGAVYKYEILTPNGLMPLKADPLGFGAEMPPATGSVVRARGLHPWQDQAWMAGRATRHQTSAPISIYEVHLGSWQRHADGRYLSYSELAAQLVPYVQGLGFTHIELMPISEFPFDGSWGYQPVGLYAPTCRHGTPEDFADFVDQAHRAGLGVILDWVPGHFPSDAHGLAQFDGTALYEHQDPREGFHQDWNTLIFNYGRAEVMNYLVANALFWLEEFHLDGLRVDAVASMLYRDYSREPGQWVPNKDGGRENYEAIRFLQEMNRLTYGHMPGILTVAEESTAFPGVTRPTDQGGLGFGYKWNMGWMNDTLAYMARDPIHRRWHHNQMSFASSYAYSENFILPISHDEVVHGKGSMIGKMPGQGEAQFANLRALYTFMWAHPGKKLLFMGQEFAQGREWSHERALDWEQLALPAHRGVQRLVGDLNRLYRDEGALHASDMDPAGMCWLDANDAEHSIYAFMRSAPGARPLVIVANLTPTPREAYRLGLPGAGVWHELLNSDADIYGGGGRGNLGQVTAEAARAQGQGHSAPIYLPPLSVLIFGQL